MTLERSYSAEVPDCRAERLRATADSGALTYRVRGITAISEAAQASGATIEWFSASFAWARTNGRRIPLNKQYVVETAIGRALSAHKGISKLFLSTAAVPVPRGGVATSLEDALALLHEIGGAVVVKPLNGNLGRGVTVNVSDEERLVHAWSRARTVGPRVVVEQYITGREFRVHATSERCVGVYERLLPTVIGDGGSTVSALIALREATRENHPLAREHPLPLDDVALAALADQGLDLDSVPEEGSVVVLRKVNGLAGGGDTRECFDEVSDLLKETAVEAVRAIPGMCWAGVDVLLEADSEIPYVIEVNANPGINGSELPTIGRPGNLSGEIWKLIAADSSPSEASPPFTTKYHQEPKALLTRSDGKPFAAYTRDVFLEYLSGRGVDVRRVTREVWTATDANGTRWFSGLQSESDRPRETQSSSNRLVSHKMLVRQGLAQLVGRTVDDADGLARFRSANPGDVLLIPRGFQQNTDRNSIFVPEEMSSRYSALLAAFDTQPSWFAQVYPRGLRFRLFATADEVLLITAERSQQRPAVTELDRIGQVAIQAVRAFPQLAWAFVDLVVRESDSANAPIYVEKMQRDAFLHSTRNVFAGGVEEVFQFLFSAAPVREKTPEELFERLSSAPA